MGKHAYPPRLLLNCSGGVGAYRLFILGQVIAAGKLTWFEGVLLHAVYAVCAAALYGVP